MRVLVNKSLLYPYIVFGVMILVASCGISDIPSFGTARVSRIATGVFSITHNTSNVSDSFIGYQVYYKFYNDADVKEIETDKDYITDTTRRPSPNTITGKGFRALIPVSYNNSSSYDTIDRNPLIRPQSKEIAEVYYVDFSTGIEGYGISIDNNKFLAGNGSEQGYQALLIEENGNKTTYLHRQLNENDTKPFFRSKSSELYEKTDTDISSMLGSQFEFGNFIRIVIAVLPYGLDFSTTQRVYGNIVLSDDTTLDYERTPQ